jgi:hypothetical protein
LAERPLGGFGLVFREHIHAVAVNRSQRVGQGGAIAQHHQVRKGALLDAVLQARELVVYLLPHENHAGRVPAVHVVGQCTLIACEQLRQLRQRKAPERGDADIVPFFHLADGCPVVQLVQGMVFDIVLYFSVLYKHRPERERILHAHTEQLRGRRLAGAEQLQVSVRHHGQSGFLRLVKINLAVTDHDALWVGFLAQVISRDAKYGLVPPVNPVGKLGSALVGVLEGEATEEERAARVNVRHVVPEVVWPTALQLYYDAQRRVLVDPGPAHGVEHADVWTLRVEFARQRVGCWLRG